MTQDWPTTLTAQKARRPRLIPLPGLIVCLVIFGGMATFLAVLGTHSLVRPAHETSIATATVIKDGGCDSTGTSTDAKATFTASNGKTYTVGVDCTFTVGQHVVIKYDPANPTHFNDDRVGAIFYYGIVVVIFLPLLAFVVWAGLAPKSDPAESASKDQRPESYDPRSSYD